MYVFWQVCYFYWIAMRRLCPSAFRLSRFVVVSAHLPTDFKWPWVGQAPKEPNSRICRSRSWQTFYPWGFVGWNASGSVSYRPKRRVPATSYARAVLGIFEMFFLFGLLKRRSETWGIPAVSRWVEMKPIEEKELKPRWLLLQTDLLFHTAADAAVKGNS